MNKRTLKEIISNIRAIYEELNELSAKKTIALKDNDITTLNSIIQKEEIQNKKILNLLEERDELFSEKIEFGPNESNEVAQEIEKLKRVSTEFSNKNEINQSLIQQSLYYINMNLSMLSTNDESDTYSPQNKKNTRKPNRVFMDSRV